MSMDTVREIFRQPNGPEPDHSLQLHYCGSQSCAPGHSFGPAVRAHYLVHFVLSGKGTYLRGEEQYELQEGDAFLILPGETTRYMADEKDPWSYTWVAFAGAGARTLLFCCGLSEQNVVYRSPGGEKARKLAQQLNSFEQSFENWNENPLQVLGHFYLLFSSMYTEQPGFPHPSGTEAAGEPYIRELSGQELYFRQACSYLEHNFSYPVKVEQLARQVGVSRTYLYKTFMHCCGKSIQQYLLELRLREARQLLQNTRRSITDIAYSCGFKDSPSFCRQFRSAQGCTPLQYRLREGSRSESQASSPSQPSQISR